MKYCGALATSTHTASLRFGSWYFSKLCKSDSIEITRKNVARKNAKLMVEALFCPTS